MCFQHLQFYSLGPVYQKHISGLRNSALPPTSVLALPHLIIHTSGRWFQNKSGSTGHIQGGQKDIDNQRGKGLSPPVTSPSHFSLRVGNMLPKVSSHHSCITVSSYVWWQNPGEAKRFPEVPHSRQEADWDMEHVLPAPVLSCRRGQAFLLRNCERKGGHIQNLRSSEEACMMGLTNIESKIKHTGWFKMKTS